MRTSDVVDHKIHACHIMMRQWQRPFVDHGVFAVRIIARTHTDVLQAQLFIETMRSCVRDAHLKRHLMCAQVTRVECDLLDKRTRDSQTPIARIGRDFQDLHPAINDPSARIADERIASVFNGSFCGI
ncbi:unknown [Eggerthella sp. CAG:298]|nr:unknown [Eggerthella sp. CAG:298]